MSKIKIEQHTFGTPGWSDEEKYVAISMAIGANTAPRAAMKGLMVFKEKSSLCKMLRQKGIRFDILPVRVDCFETPAAVQPEELEVDKLTSNLSGIAPALDRYPFDDKEYNDENDKAALEDVLDHFRKL